jgi:hypothetical protein
MYFIGASFNKDNIIFCAGYRGEKVITIRKLINLGDYISGKTKAPNHRYESAAVIRAAVTYCYTNLQVVSPLFVSSVVNYNKKRQKNTHNLRKISTWEF